MSGPWRRGRRFRTTGCRDTRCATRECADLGGARLRRPVRALLQDELGGALEEVWLFGSAARGDMWDAFWPMHSDIDLLIVSAEEIGPAREEQLVNRTYPLYLECGRQISPAFRTRAQLRSKASRLSDEVRRDGRRLWPAAAATVEA